MLCHCKCLSPTIASLGLDPRATSHLAQARRNPRKQKPRVVPVISQMRRTVGHPILPLEGRVAQLGRKAAAKLGRGYFQTYPHNQNLPHNPPTFRDTAALQRPVSGRCREGTSLSPSGSRLAVQGERPEGAIPVCSKNRQPRGGYRLFYKPIIEAKAVSGSVRLHCNRP